MHNALSQKTDNTPDNRKIIVNELRAKWEKFSEQELSALNGKDARCNVRSQIHESMPRFGQRLRMKTISATSFMDFSSLRPYTSRAQSLSFSRAGKLFPRAGYTMKAASVFSARGGDSAKLASRLRETGTLVLGMPPEDGLTLSYLSSDATYSILDAEHQVIGMFGVSAGMLDGAGSIWMVSSDAIKQPAIAIRFLKECRGWLDHLHGFYPLLDSIIHAENKVHIKWLKWLGFSFLKEITISNEPFLEFVKLKSECAAAPHQLHSPTTQRVLAPAGTAHRRISRRRRDRPASVSSPGRNAYIHKIAGMQPRA